MACSRATRNEAREEVKLSSCLCSDCCQVLLVMEEVGSDMGCQGALHPDNASVFSQWTCLIRADSTLVLGVPCSGELCFLLNWLGPPSPLELQANQKLVRMFSRGRLHAVLVLHTGVMLARLT